MVYGPNIGLILSDTFAWSRPFTHWRKINQFWLVYKQFYYGCPWEKKIYSTFGQKILTELKKNYNRQPLYNYLRTN